MSMQLTKFLYLMVLVIVFVIKLIFFQGFLKSFGEGILVTINEGVNIAFLSYISLYFLKDRALLEFYDTKNVKTFIIAGFLFVLCAYVIALKNGYTFYELSQDKNAERLSRIMPGVSCFSFVWAFFVYFEGVFNKFILWLQKRISEQN